MVMKTHDRNSSLCASNPERSGCGGLQFLAAGALRIPFTTSRDVKSCRKPTHSEAKRASCWSVGYAAQLRLPRKRTQISTRRRASRPHIKCDCVRVILRTPHTTTVMEVQSTDKPFFFPIFYFILQIHISINCRARHPPASPIHAFFDDRRLLQCLHFGLGLVRPRWISPPLFRSHPLSVLLPTPRPSHQRGTIATDHFCIRSPPHPSPNRPGQPQLSNESRPGCLVD